MGVIGSWGFGPTHGAGNLGRGEGNSRFGFFGFTMIYPFCNTYPLFTYLHIYILVLNNPLPYHFTQP